MGRHESIRNGRSITHNGTEIVRAYQENGKYVLNRNEELSKPNNKKNTNTLFLAQFKPVSLYDHVHLVTGHPGKEGMKWHLENSRHAKYTESDAQRQRGTCCRTTNVRDGTYFNDNNVRIKRIIPIRK